MSIRKKKLKLNYQIIIISLMILVIPLSVMGYYFYKTTTNGMEKIGEERATNSIKIAQSLLDNNGKNLLAITKSNSNWEEFRMAIEENNIEWIQVNVDENLTSVSILDFIITTDNKGGILSSAEEIPGLTKGIDLEKILANLKTQNEYSGLIDTPEGIAFIAVSKVTNENGQASPTGILIFGSLLNQETFNYLVEALQVEVGIVDKHNHIFASSDKIKSEMMAKDLLQGSSEILRETGMEKDTIVVHASKQLTDIANESIGSIYVESPLKTSTNVMKTLRNIGFSTVVVFAFLLSILTLVLKRRILMPLRHFTSTLERVAAGASINEIPAAISSHADNNILRLFDQLHRLSFYDFLTNLPNRRSSSNQLEQLIRNAGKFEKIAIIYLDLDRFKNINDSLGHHIGDQLLKLVAGRLNDIISNNGIVARLGGDEFAIILPDIKNLEDVEQIAESISTSFSEPLIVDDYDLFVTSSMGISIFPDDGQTVDALFMNADVAMYRAKEQGRNKYEFYDSAMNSFSIDKLKIETALQKALENDEFFLTYQPKICIETNEINGMEALIRWVHPTIGIVSPVDFIPIAEEIGLINEIGKWVLKTACRQNKVWQEQGLPPMKVAVNISARQFQHDDFIKTISAILKETELEVKWLELEITESTAMSYAEETIKKLNELNEMGIAVAIDDFGTGYSSLSYLKLFPIKSLKIDRSFIKDIEKNTGDLAIAKSIITLGRALNFEVIAEGVENEQQLDILKRENCDTFQGYYFSPPVPAEKFETMLLEVQLNV